MKKSALFLAALITSAGLHTSAHAGKVVFGDKETIRFIANTTIPSPEGERLYLGRRVLTKNFILPYNTVDEGYVLGVSGTLNKYYPLPDGERLSKIQQMGYLPNPLPPYEENWLDFFFGHMLWFFVLGIFGWIGFKSLVRKVRGK